MTRPVIQEADVEWDYERRDYGDFVLHLMAGRCGGLWSADYAIVRNGETSEQDPERHLKERVLAALRHKDDATR